MCGLLPLVVGIRWQLDYAGLFAHQHVPDTPDCDKETGVGNFNVFGAYLIDIGNPANSF